MFVSGGWMDKQIVVYSYSEILFSNKREQIADVCHNLGMFQGHYIER